MYRACVWGLGEEGGWLFTWGLLVKLSVRGSRDVAAALGSELAHLPWAAARRTLADSPPCHSHTGHSLRWNGVVVKLWSPAAWVLAQDLPLAGSWNLENFINFSVPQFTQLYHGDNRTYLLGEPQRSVS